MQVTSNKPHSKQLNEVRIVTALVVNLVETYSSRGAYKGAISAWRVSSDMANKISTVIGVYKSQIVVVIEGCQLKLSTPDVNELHDDGCDGRYFVVGGDVYEDTKAWLKPHPWLFKSLASVQGPRYLSLEDAGQIPSGKVMLR